MLANREGQQVPNITFKTRENKQFAEVTSEQLFANKTVVVFSLPGAFTPTCSSIHLPRYNELAHTLKQNGVDDILCVSVNDAFVMDAWKQNQEAENVTLIPDGNGDFSEGMGMLVDKSDLGFGKRSWRYSMLVKNGVIVKQFIEPQKNGDPFEVSDADTMLEYINPSADKPKSVTVVSKPGCPFCAKAKAMLKEHSMPFEEITLGENATSRLLVALSGQTQVPAIFIDGKMIAGSDALETYLG
ncbi:glutathione peroxidase [Pseudomonadota bacterium]